MKMTIRCWTVAFIGMATLGYAAASRNFDFSGMTTADIPIPFATLGNGRAIDVNPATGRKALRLSWDADRAPRYEWEFRQKPLLDGVTQAVFRIHYSAPAGCTARRLTLRLMDSKNEVFQITAPFTGRDGGSGSVDYYFDATALRGVHNWAHDPANKDGRVDLPLRLMGMSLGFTPGSGQGALWIDAMDLFPIDPEQGDTSSGRLAVRIECGSPLHVLAPAAGTAELVVRMPHGMAAGNYSISGSVRGFRYRPCPGAADFAVVAALAPGGEQRIALPVPDSAGAWQVSGMIVNEADAADRSLFNCRYATMVANGLAEHYDTADFRFGACSHPDRDKDPAIWDMEARAMATAGIRYLRHGTSMGSVLNPDMCMKTELFNGITAAFMKQGVERVASVGYTTRWAMADKSIDTRTPHAQAPDVAVWREYVRKIFTHARGKVRFWEVWNEADLPFFCAFPAETYAELAAIAREELDRVSPEASLMTSGFATVVSPDKGHFQRDALTLCKDLFDIHCFHGHGGFTGYVRLIDDQLLPLRRDLAMTIPWYAHETALTATGFGEDVQAEALFKKLLFSWSRGSIGYTWYNLRNKGVNPNDAEHNYGLLTIDFQPKPVYVAYNALIALYGAPGTCFVKQHAAPAGRWLLQFSNGREQLIAAWNEHPGSHEMLWRSDAASAELVDIMGNAQPVPRDGEVFRLNVSEDPVTLRLHGATFAEMLPPVMALPNELFVIPGACAALTAAIHNPHAQAATLTADVDLPEGLTSTETQLVVELAPGENRRVSLAVRAARDFTASTQRPAVLRVRYTFRGVTHEQTLPVSSASRLLPDCPEPLFLLNRRDQVHSSFDANPGTLDKLWHSPQDLSAMVFFSADEQNCELIIEVIDDIHQQPFAAADIWRGDSVQFFFFVPGQDACWQFGMARRDDGTDATWCWGTPSGSDPNAVSRQLAVTTSRDGSNTRYAVTLPWQALKVNPDIARKGLRFNLMVNDSDLGVREGWIRIAPGVGSDVSETLFPWLVLP
ncbi:MAG: hypothetical protein GX617_00090 [Lentisphaerae bacterium]|nr:hypothetical protein [Lentisphaerota bacterium]